MGNICPACLSTGKPDHFSCNIGEDDDLLTRVASTRAHADDLYKPLLKPCIVSNNNQLKGNLLRMKGGAHELIAAPADAAANLQDSRRGNPLKAMKNVRFAEEVTLISTSGHQKSDLLVRSQAKNKGETASEELVRIKKKSESGIYINPATIVIDQSTAIAAVTQSSNIVRMKVVITKKELSALVLQTAEKQRNIISTDSLILERILTPLLSTQSSSFHKISHTFQSVHQQYGIPPWRPSLEHISEDH